MANELPIPPEALAHRSVEMIRVWLANQKLQTVLNIGFWQERGLNERAAWGILIADMVRHIADAHAAEYGHDADESVAMIRNSFEAEMQHPTSGCRGEFVRQRREETDPGTAPDGGGTS